MLISLLLLLVRSATWEDVISDVCSFRLVDDVIDNDDNPRKYNMYYHNT